MSFFFLLCAFRPSSMYSAAPVHNIALDFDHVLGQRRNEGPNSDVVREGTFDVTGRAYGFPFGL